LSRKTDHFPIFIEEPYEKLNTARCVRNGATWDYIQQCFLHARDRLHKSKEPPNLGMLQIRSKDYRGS